MAMGYVYMIEAMKMKRFKIGKAKVLPRRFNQLDTASPCELRIYGVIKSENYESIERELHNKLDSRRTKRANRRPKEWFKLTKREVEKIVFKYGGFCAADGDYADDLSLFNKIVKWINSYPRVVEKFCCSIVGAMMLSYFAASMAPVVMPKANAWIPDYRHYVPLNELVTDYHHEMLRQIYTKKDVAVIGVTMPEYLRYWEYLWRSYTNYNDSVYAGKPGYAEWKEIISGWSVSDSMEYTLQNYVWGNFFVEAYSDSEDYSPDAIEWFTHDNDTSKCPMKDMPEFVIDGIVYGGHNDCIGELRGRKANAEKAIQLLREIRKRFPDMVP